MKKISIILIISFIKLSLITAQDKPAYILYKNNAKKVTYAKMLKDVADSDMIFFGEFHTDPIAHWLQIELTKSLYEIKGNKLFLGAEMFENGNQLVIDEYLAGFYPEKKMLPEITQLWDNYNTDYKPLLDFAKENNLRFIATNIPRRYASMIYKGSLEVIKKLSPKAKSMIGPDLEELFDSTVYSGMKSRMGTHIPKNMLNIQAAQASKDATMAHFSIINHHDGDLLLHFDGAYHSEYNGGIIWWINKIKPELKIKTITTVYQSKWNEMTKEQKKNIANYIIVIADGMTQTKR